MASCNCNTEHEGPHVSDTTSLRFLLPIQPPTTPTLPGSCNCTLAAAAMSIHLRAHAFAASPLRGLSASTAAVSPSAAADALRSLLDAGAGAADAAHPHPHPHLSKILPFRRGRPLARSYDSPPPPAAAAAAPPPPPAWRLAWLPPARVPDVPSDAFVFLGAHGEEEGKEAAAYWAVDVSERDGEGAGDGSAFVDLRTLMVATDWRDKDAMGDLAIAGHVRGDYFVVIRDIRITTFFVVDWISDSSRLGRC